MARIVVDARAISNPLRGVGVYSLEMVRRISEAEVVLYSHNSDVKEYFSTDNYKFHIPKKILRVIPGTIYILFVLPFFLKKYDIFLGLNHVVPFFGRFKKILIVHDLVAFKFPKALTLSNRLLFKIGISLSIRNAETIACVSNFTIKELSQYYSLNKNDLFLLPCGLDRFSRNNGQNTKENFILSVGTLEPRKNIELLIQAYLYLRDQKILTIPLKVVGAYGWKVGGISGDGIEYLGYLNDTELDALYSKAKYFVYPSLYEGFGIPPFEAYNSGALVLAGSTCAIHDYLKEENGVFITDSETLESMADKLWSLVTIESNDSVYVDLDLTWDNTFEKLKRLF